MGSSQYEYSALRDDKHIRLLRLSPSSNRADRLQARLFEYPFPEIGEQTHLYEALSYTWGPPSKSHSIWIEDKELLITANCHAALQQLRDRFIERILWVDAICINQGSKEERAKQVQLMAEVYCKARQVIVWLGEATHDSADAIEKIRAAARNDEISARKGDVIPESVTALLNRPWFRRVWILQEVAAAQHVVILCGSSQIDGYAFCLGLPSYIDTDESFGVISSVEYLIRGSIFRPRYARTASGSVTLGIRPLGELMDIYHAHDATESLDKVFALLGMSTDGSSVTELTPDYSLPWNALFSRLITFLLGPKVTVKTTGSNKIAVISGKGVVIGKVASVGLRSNRDRNIPVIITYTEPFESVWPSDTWNFHAGVKGVQVDDILCLLDGAPSPMLIRQHGSHFSVVMITVTSAQPKAEQPQISTWRNFVLSWDLDATRKKPSDKEVRTWVDESILECTIQNASEPMRRGNLLRGTAQILEDARISESAVETFHKAVDSYSLILPEDDPTRVQCSTELAGAYTSLDQWDKSKELLEYAVRTRYRDGYDLQQLIDLLTELRFVLKLGGYQEDEWKWRTVQNILQAKQSRIPIKDELIIYTLEWLNSEAVSILIDQEDDLDRIGNERTLTAAARNIHYGVEVMKTLLEQLGKYLNISESVFIAVAENHPCGHELMEMMLQREGNTAQITQEILKSAASNSWRNKILVKTLFSHQGIEVDLDSVTDEAWLKLASFMYARRSTSTDDKEHKDKKATTDEGLKEQELSGETKADIDDTLSLIGAFLKINEATALRTILSAADPSVLFGARRQLYQLALDEQNWVRLDEFIQIVPPSMEDIISTLAYVLMSKNKHAAKRLLDIAKREGVNASDPLTVAEEVVSGCCRLIETQTPTELSSFLDYTYHLGVSLTRRHKLDALPTQSAILPAAISHDQRFMRILVERNIVTAWTRPFTIRSIWQVESEDEDQHKIRHERFPPEGMPDWPLYCAITFTFDPRSIEFLCRAGAKIDLDAPNTPEDRKEPAIVVKLQQNPSLDQARKDFVNLKEMCNTIAKVGMNPRFQEFTNRGSGDYYQYYYDGILWDQSFTQAWKSMDSVLGWDWFGDEVLRCEGTEKWPGPLRSEEAWDGWREKVLDTLRSFWDYHLA
ncbi:hypothetical protein IL306_014160 [Fusarium sp. DS 682]|nr:hypothetical protein IL306_014160 [Fusarium sp. DS 682]